MKRFSPTAGFVFALLLYAGANAEPPNKPQDVQTIPLDQIWGYNLPGTRHIAGIPFPDDKEGIGQTFAYLNRERDTNIEHIRRALASKPPTEKAAPGFVLPRRPDSLTLRGVHPLMLGKRNPFDKDSFGENEDLTLVFFSHPLSYHARLKKVERKQNDITVHYQFEPHTTPESTVHFALIPLGKLPAGEYQVDYQQIPVDQKYREMGFEPVHPEAAEIVCRDFSFTVDGPVKSEPPIKGATLIPLDQIWAHQMPGTRNVRDLEQSGEPISEEQLRKSLVWQLDRDLFNRRKEGKTAGPAFVVIGTGKEALDNAYTVITEHIEPEQLFSAGTDLSLVFYSHMSGGYYVHLDSIERAERKIRVNYRFVAHNTGDATSHFALIPLGRLPEGKFHVEIKQVPSLKGSPHRDLSWLVCEDTSFRVKERPP